MARYSKKGQETVKEVMEEFKEGVLKSGKGGKKVTSRKQAVAIGLSEARQKGARVRPPRRSTQKDGPMTNTATETLSVVVEREMPFPPEKIWRALTQPHLIEEWLMKNDFKPVVGHSFNLRADWGVVDCQVRAVEPNKTLSYTWGAYGLESVVTWTLTPTSTGTHLRMEQSGFRPDQPQYYQGAKGGWQGFFAALEQVLARID